MLQKSAPVFYHARAQSDWYTFAGCLYNLDMEQNSAKSVKDVLTCMGACQEQLKHQHIARIAVPCHTVMKGHNECCD